ncbi:inactive protein RESTRICTED TEV MOVEMENT 2-like [Prosopis cineraria]|uniref:inactive protein RESTRICTED TEV MOVEMENT 2-like n=1 Tax=Prosopis cineraria TaxID=364024 RepID=UPI00240FB3B7|nr:inactive protein RESTRICTED TEV MOVEMENT 2-like [Prosopis cineraria]
MALNRVYEDFQPPHDWVRDEQSETLILQLEGFSRSQLKVQISAMRRIRVSGERQIEGNIWRRFYSEFPVPQDSDTNNIGAKFERGTLYVRFPKLITPVTPQPPPTQQAPSAAPPPRTQQLLLLHHRHLRRQSREQERNQKQNKQSRRSQKQGISQR